MAKFECSMNSLPNRLREFIIFVLPNSSKSIFQRVNITLISTVFLLFTIFILCKWLSCFNTHTKKFSTNSTVVWLLFWFSTITQKKPAKCFKGGLSFPFYNYRLALCLDHSWIFYTVGFCLMTLCFANLLVLQLLYSLIKADLNIFGCMYLGD